MFFLVLHTPPAMYCIRQAGLQPLFSFFFSSISSMHFFNADLKQVSLLSAYSFFNLSEFFRCNIVKDRLVKGMFYFGIFLILARALFAILPILQANVFCVILLSFLVSLGKYLKLYYTANMDRYISRNPDLSDSYMNLFPKSYAAAQKHNADFSIVTLKSGELEHFEANKEVYLLVDKLKLVLSLIVFICVLGANLSNPYSSLFSSTILPFCMFVVDGFPFFCCVFKSAFLVALSMLDLGESVD